jgi:hypothetical protein
MSAVLQVMENCCLLVWYAGLLEMSPRWKHRCVEIVAVGDYCLIFDENDFVQHQQKVRCDEVLSVLNRTMMHADDEQWLLVGRDLCFSSRLSGAVTFAKQIEQHLHSQNFRKRRSVFVQAQLDRQQHPPAQPIVYYCHFPISVGVAVLGLQRR